MKTSFITPFGAFWYMTMPFGLKNAGATYQRCIQNCFKEQIRRNVHAYVDNVVIKSQKADSLIADLTETFNNLRKYKMKLNPSKCVFGVPAGKLLALLGNSLPPAAKIRLSPTVCKPPATTEIYTRTYTLSLHDALPIF